MGDMFSNPIVQSLVATALYDVMKKGLTFVHGLSPQSGDRINIICNQKVIDAAPIIRAAIDEVVSDKRLGANNFSIDVERIIKSSEFESAVRQVFSTVIVNPDEGLDSIEETFIKTVSLLNGQYRAEIDGEAKIVFSFAVRICRKVLSGLVEQGSLIAHDASSNIRFQIMIAELNTVKKTLELLKRPQLNLQEINEFVGKYKLEAAKRHGLIRPPHMYEGKRMAIDSIYVSPQILAANHRQNAPAANTSISLETFKNSAFRSVILGDPGGGKSTLSHKLIYDIASDQGQFSSTVGTEVAPILVILREYGVQKNANCVSIIQYVEQMIFSKYQLQVPFACLDYLLLSGRALIIFDGLDELLETKYRQEITEDVESFCRQYPSAPVVVTSREVGYDRAPLSDEMFTVYRLRGFNPPQIRKYVTNWFQLTADLTPDQQQAMIRSFIDDSQSISDICSNPLMLGLLCNIYRAENYLPRNRPNIYKKCADMLFEQWDRGRGIKVNLPFSDAFIRPTMQELAYWILSSPELQRTVTADQLMQRTAMYLKKKCFENIEEAEYAAREFVDFCRGRAWVFTDVGTTECGDHLYQFTHGTFLEFFSAEYIVRNYSMDEIKAILQSKVIRFEWDMVLQIVMQLKDCTQENAANELLEFVVEKATEYDSQEGWGYTAFAVRCLEFIIPPPPLRRKVVDSTLNKSFELIDKFAPPKPIRGVPGGLQYEPATTLGRLCITADMDNQKTICGCVEEYVVEALKNQKAPNAVFACELLSFVYRANKFVYLSRKPIAPLWVEMKDRVLSQYKEAIIECAKTNRNIIFDCFMEKLLTELDSVLWFGADGLFNRHASQLHRRSFPSLMTMMYRRMLHELYGKDESNVPYYESVAEELIKCELPWIKNSRNFYADEEDYRWEDDHSLNLAQMEQLEKENTVPILIFYAFINVAIGIEAMQEKNRNSYLGSTKSPWISCFRDIAFARYGIGEMNKANLCIDHFNISEVYKALMRQWANCEISFTNVPVKNSREDELFSPV